MRFEFCACMLQNLCLHTFIFAFAPFEACIYALGSLQKSERCFTATLLFLRSFDVLQRTYFVLFFFCVLSYHIDTGEKPVIMKCVCLYEIRDFYLFSIAYPNFKEE